MKVIVDYKMGNNNFNGTISADDKITNERFHNSDIFDIVEGPNVILLKIKHNISDIEIEESSDKKWN